MTFDIYQQIFERYSDINFHENPSWGSQVVPLEQTDGQTGVTKLIVTFAILRTRLKAFHKHSIGILNTRYN
jgi:hypothetical protein